jgi:hypothetical protein
VPGWCLFADMDTAQTDSVRAFCALSISWELSFGAILAAVLSITGMAGGRVKTHNRQVLGVALRFPQCREADRAF